MATRARLRNDARSYDCRIWDPYYGQGPEICESSHRRWPFEVQVSWDYLSDGFMIDREFLSPDEKKFLFDIVANKRNGLDVDKWVFLCLLWTTSNYFLQVWLHSARLTTHWWAYPDWFEPVFVLIDYFTFHLLIVIFPVLSTQLG